MINKVSNTVIYKSKLLLCEWNKNRLLDLFGIILRRRSQIQLRSC